MTEVYVIDKPAGVEYLTVEQSLMKNGCRHLSNAIGYASRGMFQHSDGSIRKAQRNFARSKELSLGFAYPMFAVHQDWLTDCVADTIRGHVDGPDVFGS